MKTANLTATLLIAVAFLMPSSAFGYDEKDAYADLQTARKSCAAMSLATKEKKVEKLRKKGMHALLRISASPYIKGAEMEALMANWFIVLYGSTLGPEEDSHPSSASCR